MIFKYAVMVYATSFLSGCWSGNKSSLSVTAPPVACSMAAAVMADGFLWPLVICVKYGADLDTKIEKAFNVICFSLQY